MEIKAMNKDDIFKLLQTAMVELFELEAEQIEPQTDLFKDLDIDSIDFIDLAVKIRDITGQRVDPEDFKKVRTMQDLVETAYMLYQK